ncbi:conserved protein of unknown function [Limnospira indica PCC 8005]|uniref:Uncharacterized protein n=1 Tax=Limnospira indica PCC 8005 TaxID=376219 RepID=A0A9P1KEX2_9CYAN|nr:conserved protein of unknown function [Limnospira indica PCC 8005]
MPAYYKSDCSDSVEHWGATATSVNQPQKSRYSILTNEKLIEYCYLYWMVIFN